MSEDAKARQWCHRLLDVWVTFEMAAGDQYDLTDGDLIRAVQQGMSVEPGARVRVNHHDDNRRWFEVWRVLAVHHSRPPMAAAMVAATSSGR